MVFMVLRMPLRYYFNKEPKDLDLNESTMLAGVVNGPEYYSPFKDMKGAKARQKLVFRPTC